MTFISRFCSLVILLALCRLPLGNCSTPMSVTPPALSAGSEEVEVDAPGCYDRSDVPVDSVWNRLCKPFRECLPEQAASIKNFVHFKSDYTNILSNKPNSLAQLDVEYEKSLLVKHLESISKKGTARAQKCLEYGSYFLCSTLYPMCTDYNIIWPCRETCELTQTLCHEELAEEGYPGLFPNLFDCDAFPTDESRACSPTTTLSSCSLNYDISRSGPVTVTPNNTQQNTTTTTQPPPTTNNDTSTDNTTTSSTDNTTTSSTDDTTTTIIPAPPQCPRDNGMLLEKCDCKKKVRVDFSKGSLSKASYNFFVHVRVINRYITMFDGHCQYAYNVSIIDNYYPDCSNTHYGCATTDSIVTIYTGDKGDEDCCVTPNFDSVKQGINEFVVGGYFKEDKWYLEGEDNGCTIAVADGKIKEEKIPKIERWISSAAARRRRRR